MRTLQPSDKGTAYTLFDVLSATQLFDRYFGTLLLQAQGLLERWDAQHQFIALAVFKGLKSRVNIKMNPLQFSNSVVKTQLKTSVYQTSVIKCDKLK